MTLALTRIVPTYRKTVQFTWIRRDWMTFGAFRTARERMKLKEIYRVCFWCKKSFSDADKMALAGRPRKGNVILCDGCASQADGEVNER